MFDYANPYPNLHTYSYPKPNSKLTFDDAKRFVGPCSDVFPEGEAKDIELPDLQVVCV